MPGWLARARRMMVSPRDEWRAIAGEFTNAGAIYRGYIIPLAAIGPIASLVGTSLFGMRTLFGTYRISIGGAIANAVIGYVLSLVVVYAFAFVIDVLAPTFGGQRNQVQALKVAAYSSTPGWLGGVFNLAPVVAMVGLVLYLYNFYLLYLGLPAVMKSPQDKSAGYTVVTVVGAIVLFLVAGALSAAFLPAPVR